MAEDDDDSQKTEEPSGRKLAKAKEKGQTAVSQEVKTWAILIGAAFSVPILAPWVMGRVERTARPFITRLDTFSVDRGSLQVLFGEVAWEMFLTLAPLFGIMVVLALVSSLAQSGLVWAPEKIKPDLSKINPLKGVKKIISIKQTVEFLKGIAKIVIVAAIAIGLTLPLLDDVRLIPHMDLKATLDRLHEIALWLLVAVAMVITAVAAVDYIFQKYTFMKQMRMTKQEVKDEHKQSEGDPLIKAKIRSLRIQRARQRMMAAVPEADVVVTNPTHYAVALAYKMEQMSAPRLVAKGVDKVAFRIREVAEENDVPIVENPPLARALFASVELEEEIPPEHYKAVAEVIGYVMRMRGKLPGGEAIRPH